MFKSIFGLKFFIPISIEYLYFKLIKNHDKEINEMNFKLGDKGIKMKWHEPGTKKKIWVPGGNRTHDLPNTGRTLYPLIHRN